MARAKNVLPDHLSEWGRLVLAWEQGGCSLRLRWQVLYSFLTI